MSSEQKNPNDSRRGFLKASLVGAVAAGIKGTMADAQEPVAPPDKQPPDLQVPDAPKKTIGYAVVGLGQLALEEVMPAFSQSKIARPVALVSGHPEKAKKVAAAYKIDPASIYSYDTYEKLADNPAVDAIYIILPNSMHKEYTIRGLKIGKHVLCEKPMAASVAESNEMIAAAKAAQRKLMIAYRLRYEPFNMAAIEVCRKGELGKLKTIIAANCQNVKAPNIRLSKAHAGGPLGDVGVYCINAFRYLSGEEPTEVSAHSFQPSDDPRFSEVPESVSFLLKFPSGLLANGLCSFGTNESRSFTVQGASGVLAMEAAFAYRGQRLRLKKEDKDSELGIKAANHFAAEMDHFAECILSGKEPRTSGEDGLADMRIIAAIEESVKSGKAIKV